jgi:hypothetical protein
MLTITLMSGIALLISTAKPHAQTARTPSDELQQLLRLDDQTLGDRLHRDWSGVRASLDLASSPGSVRTRQRRGFAGPQEVCLQSHAAAPCRVHMRDLVDARQKKEQQAGSLLLNPWAAATR